MVLAQVPLSRFLRVPTRRSHAEWLQRVGHVSVDLLLCDRSSQVLAAIDLRHPQESERSRTRHERMSRVLRAAGIDVHVWREGALPTRSQVRALFGAHFSATEAEQAAPASNPVAADPTAPLVAAVAAPATGTGTARPRVTTKPLPGLAIPVPDISELLAEGDAIAARHAGGDPVASTFFDDLDSLPTKSGAQLH